MRSSSYLIANHQMVGRAILPVYTEVPIYTTRIHDSSTFYYVGVLGVSLVGPVPAKCDWSGCKWLITLL